MNNYMGINHYVTVYIIRTPQSAVYVLAIENLFIALTAHWISHHQCLDEHKIQIWVGLFAACFILLMLTTSLLFCVWNQTIDEGD